MGELTTIKSIKSMMDNPDMKKKFQEMLGDRVQGFFVSVSNCVSNNALLQKAEPKSVMMAAAIAASLDLPIDPNLGFAYIVPYNTKIKGQNGEKDTFITVAQFQMGWKGFVQLAQRSGAFKTIAATRITEGQLKSENPLLGYEFDFSTRGKENVVIGYAAYFKLLNGFEKTIYMTVDELKSHGTRFSQTYKKGFGLWKDDFDSMATKTVIKLLLSKFAPLSIQMQTAVNTDQSVVKSIEGGVIDSEYVDNTPDSLIISEVETEKQRERVAEHINNATTLAELEEVSELAFQYDLTDLYTVKHDSLNGK